MSQRHGAFSVVLASGMLCVQAMRPAYRTCENAHVITKSNTLQRALSCQQHHDIKRQNQHRRRIKPHL